MGEDRVTWEAPRGSSLGLSARPQQSGQLAGPRSCGLRRKSHTPVAVGKPPPWAEQHGRLREKVSHSLSPGLRVPLCTRGGLLDSPRTLGDVQLGRKEKTETEG